MGLGSQIGLESGTELSSNASRTVKVLIPSLQTKAKTKLLISKLYMQLDEACPHSQKKKKRVDPAHNFQETAPPNFWLKLPKKIATSGQAVSAIG